MPDIVLLLGPIAFQEFEIPSAINFGGEQRLEVHRLPGGTRVIDTLGRDDARISFSGIFSGSNATLRARSVDELRAAGLPLELTWDVFFFTVLISNFHADYRNSWWVPFRVTCTVLRDEAAALIQPTISFVAAIAADIGIAIGQGLNGGIDLSQLQTVFAAPNAAVRGTGTYMTAQSDLTAAQNFIDGAVGAADAALSNMDLANAASADDGAAGLLNATISAGRLSSLTTAGAYVRRAAINLSNAST